MVLETTRGSGPGGLSDPKAVVDLFTAHREGVVRRLDERWGESRSKSLDGVFLRAEDPQERIPKPWAYLGAYVRQVDLWKAGGGGRWVAVGVSDPADGPEIQLFALVTDLAPP